MRKPNPLRQRKVKSRKKRQANRLSALEQSLRDAGVQYLAGTDEVGRGCLAGPVVAATVIYPSEPNLDFPLVADSKILSPKRRETLFAEICQHAVAWSIAAVDAEDIDRINIHQASLLVMRKSVEALSQCPDYLLVDGCFTLDLSLPQQAVIDGDAQCQVIGAASIIAKVWRDRLMGRMQEQYPAFQFGRHKGYGTRLHREELSVHGPTDIHRRSFRGVSRT